MSDVKAQRKATVYHEVGHAVLAWNFGIPVERISISYAGRSGQIFPARRPSTMMERLAEIVFYLGGVAADKRWLEAAGEHHYSSGTKDFPDAARMMSKLLEMPAGVEWLVVASLVGKVERLVEEPDIQMQIRALVEPLRTTDHLFGQEINRLLKNCPTTRRAVELCSMFLKELARDLPHIIAKESERADEAAQFASAMNPSVTQGKD